MQSLNQRPIPLLLALSICAFFHGHAAQPPGSAVSYKTIAKSSNALRVHFIDIGPGDAILIETPAPTERHIFIDGGKHGGSSVLKPYLQRFVGTNQIDLSIVTHPDYDHINGMKLVFENYTVLQYWDTGYDSPQLSDTWRELQQLVGLEQTCSAYTPISQYYQPGARFIADANDPADPNDDVVLQFVNVDGDPPYIDPDSHRHFSESERRNNASLVLKLIYHNVSFLLTGDINGRRKEHIGAAFDPECDAVEKFLVGLDNQSTSATTGFLSATVLKAPHHGSNGSSSLPFLREVAPQWVVFCAGHEYDHPTVDTLRRYQDPALGIPASHLLRTDQGDSTPEVDSMKDKNGDDCFIFETDGATITRIRRVKI